MILKTLLDYLSETLSVGVYVEAPKELTNYVLLEQIGSSETNHIITTSFTIQSYAASMYEAMVLNDEVKQAMEGFVQLDQITRVECETDYSQTNAATKQYRWQAVYDITHY